MASYPDSLKNVTLQKQMDSTNKTHFTQRHSPPLLSSPPKPRPRSPFSLSYDFTGPSPPSLQHSNNISQPKWEDDRGISLEDSLKLPQSSPDALLPSYKVWVGNSDVHGPIQPKAVSSIFEDSASEFSFGSRTSGVSSDSGYYSGVSYEPGWHSFKGSTLASSFGKGHPHWCYICENPSVISTCDGFKRHMREHETSYPCLVCELQEDRSHTKARIFTRKANLVKHLQSHGSSYGSKHADSWRRPCKKKFYSCGICICLFGNLMELLKHVDDHYKDSKTLGDWDRNKVIIGLLGQPGVKDVWQRTLASYSISEQLLFTWNLSEIGDLQLRLELSEDSPEDLVVLALTSSKYDSKQHDMISPLHQDNNVCRNMDDDPGVSGLRFEYYPSTLDDAFDDEAWHSARQQGSYELQKPGADASWRLEDESREDPWDPFSIHEKELFCIRNHDPLFAITGEGHHHGSKCYDSAAEHNSRSVDTQRVGIELRVTEEALCNLPLQANTLLPNGPTASGIRLRDSLDQSAGNIIPASEPELPPGNPVVSMSKRRKRRSAEDERGDNTACDIRQERKVHVSLYTSR